MTFRVYSYGFNRQPFYLYTIIYYIRGPRQLSRYSDSLRNWRSRDWNPEGQLDIQHPSRFALRPTQPPIQQAPCLPPWIKRPGDDVDHPLSSAEVKERVGLYIYSTSGSSWIVLGRTSYLLPFYILHTLRNFTGYAHIFGRVYAAIPN